MKNENEIKRAFAMEVIEALRNEIDSRTDKGLTISGLASGVEIVKAMHPQEEDTKIEKVKKICDDFSKDLTDQEKSDLIKSDEVKVGDEVEVTEVYQICKVIAVHDKHAWVITKESGRQYLPLLSDVRKYIPEPTLEQKARKKAEEEWREWCYAKGYDNDAPMLNDDYIEIRTKHLLIDPKTL